MSNFQGWIVGGLVLLIVLLLVVWLAGAFESAEDRCSRLAERAYPYYADQSDYENRLQEQEWRRYFNKCMAKNRRAERARRTGP